MTAPATLRRTLGRWDLVAIGVNQVIGSGIFLLPSLVTAQVGAWAVLAFGLAGVASLLVALCFAEVGSHERDDKHLVPVVGRACRGGGVGERHTRQL